MPKTKRSVLRVSDQHDGVFPDRCVLTGQKTDTAVYIWAIESARSSWLIGAFGYVGVLLAKALGKPVQRLGLPISEGPWQVWKRRSSLCAVMLSAGFGVMLVGLLRSSVGLVVFGLIVAVLSLPLRLRALQNYWVGAELRSKPGHILVSPTHPSFDKQASELFRRSL